MTAKKYLGELKRMTICIEQKEAERQALYSASLGSSLSERERVQGSSEDKMTGLVARIIELQAEIDEQVLELLERKHIIIAQIQGMQNENHVEVLYKRYVEFKRLEKIACEIGYSYDHVRHLHGCALQRFERRYQLEIEDYEFRMDES